MLQIPVFLKELNEESITTRKMLERIPEDKFDWKPHPKSMSMQNLATHIAELPTWIAMALTTPELDFAKSGYAPTVIKSNADLMNLFKQSLEIGQSHLIPSYEEILGETWILRTGDKIHSSTTKAEVIRMSLNQIVHHRAQMGVYLRLLDIPIPGSYGPSADENNF